MKISGLIIASDGENKKGMIDLIDIPFYGGNKYLMKDKILSPSIKLVNGEPIVSASINAMGQATIIADFVIVGRLQQCEQLENLAEKYSNNKPFKVIPNEGHIGETVAIGAQNISLLGYFFILQPDLPFVSGNAVDEAALEILAKASPDISIYFPVIDKEFFRMYSQGWSRPFFLELTNGSTNKYKSLDFVIADSARINPEFVRKFYNIRMIRSLKGKINAFREFPKYVPQSLLRYAGKRLTFQHLEEIGSELNGNNIRIIQLTNHYASSFMKDIDTKLDYQTYLRAIAEPKNQL